jgi:hypothetical protein
MVRVNFSVFVLLEKPAKGGRTVTIDHRMHKFKFRV